jgi:hypothetical protein
VPKKSFQEAFEEWKNDTRYAVGEDIGWEYSDDKEAGPTPVKRSSTLKDNGATRANEAVLRTGPQTS